MKRLILAISLALGGAIVISSCSRSSPSFVAKSQSAPASRHSGSLFSVGTTGSSPTVPATSVVTNEISEIDPDVQAGVVFGNLDLAVLSTQKNTPPAAQSEFKKQVELLPSAVAVIIENLSVVRDKGVQGGFSQAELIYEALVEGGITRFMLVLPVNLEGDYRLRPVRSSRSYFVSWALPFGNYVHFGTAASTQDRRVDAQGMAEELERQGLLHRLHMDDTGGVFARDNLLNVATEHTLYTSTQRLLAELKRRNWIDVSPQGQSFLPQKAEAPLGNRGQEGQIVNVGFDGAYSVEWIYNREENVYYREQGGKPHIDYQLDEANAAVTKVPITAKNIIIQFCEVQPSAQTGDARVIYQTTGEGEAWFFLDGQVIKGRWRRQPGSDQSKFASFSTQSFEYFDSEGKLIQFNPGQTWVEMVTGE